MKIETTGKTLSSNLLRTGDSRSGATQATAPASSGSVTAQSVTTHLQTVESNDTGSAFDADKVSAIRQAISEGRFSVRADAIADKLLDSVKELLAQ